MINCSMGRVDFDIFLKPYLNKKNILKKLMSVWLNPYDL